LQCVGAWGIVRSNEAPSPADFDTALVDASAAKASEGIQERVNQSSELRQGNQQASELELVPPSNCPQTLCCPKTCLFDVSKISAFRLPKSMFLACPQLTVCGQKPHSDKTTYQDVGMFSTKTSDGLQNIPTERGRSLASNWGPGLLPTSGTLRDCLQLACLLANGGGIPTEWNSNSLCSDTILAFFLCRLGGPSNGLSLPGGKR
jgi:hypothetical protein